MTAPQDDPALIHKLSALTDDEFRAVVDKARGPVRDPEPLPDRGSGDPHQRALRDAEASGDRQRAFALKARHLGRLIEKG